MTKHLLIWLVTAAALVQLSFAQDDEQKPTAEEQIRAAGLAYVTAFNAQDAKAIAEQWSPEAVYTNRNTGEEVSGRDAIAAQFAAIFEGQKDIKVDVSVESIQLISPNAAVEHGIAKFLVPDVDPEVVSYTAVYVRSGGKWLLDRVTDMEPEVIPSHYDQLKELEWMVGSWVDEDDEISIVTECNWTRNKNFLTRSFTVSRQGDVEMAGMQIVGWDAADKQIRSWTFDSDGGWSQGVWTKDGDRWYIRKRGVLADGKKASAVNTVKYIDENSFTFKSAMRTVGGEILPNIDEVLIVRK